MINGVTTLQSLEKLVVRSRHIQDSHLEKLTQLVNLHTLELHDHNRHLTNAFYASLAKFEKLERFALDSTSHVTGEGIEQLRCLPNFRSLSMYHLVNDGLRGVSQLQTLQTLELCGGVLNIQPETLTALGQLPELHTLSIRNDRGVAFFTYGPNLLSHITGFHKLQKLKISSWLGPQNKDLRHLPKLPELTELEIDKCTYLNDKALVSLSKWPKLKKAHLTGAHFTPEALQKFRREHPDITISI